MNKAEIQQELPELSPEEMSLLDRELEDYQQNPDAGSSWEEVEARLRKRTHH